jgi:hypothetical protein
MSHTCPDIYYVVRVMIDLLCFFVTVFSTSATVQMLLNILLSVDIFVPVLLFLIYKKSNLSAMMVCTMFHVMSVMFCTFVVIIIYGDSSRYFPENANETTIVYVFVLIIASVKYLDVGTSLGAIYAYANNFAYHDVPQQLDMSDLSVNPYVRYADPPPPYQEAVSSV